MSDVINDQDLRRALAANLPRLRKQRGLTQAQLAEAVGAHPVTIARFEIGTRLPSGPLLFSLADALGVTTDALRQVAEEKSGISA